MAVLRIVKTFVVQFGFEIRSAWRSGGVIAPEVV
jgi:hypothetical protein